MYKEKITHQVLKRAKISPMLFAGLDSVYIHVFEIEDIKDKIIEFVNSLYIDYAHTNPKYYKDVKVNKNNIDDRCRYSRVSLAKHLCMYILRRLNYKQYRISGIKADSIMAIINDTGIDYFATIPYQAIAKITGVKAHASVINGIKHIDNMIFTKCENGKLIQSFLLKNYDIKA